MKDVILPRIAQTFPPSCACCLAPTKDTRRIFKRQLGSVFGRTALQEKQLRIPYCTFCNRHADWTTGGGMVGVVISFVAFVLLFWVAVVFVWSMLNLAGILDESNSLRDEVVQVGLTFALAGIFSWRRYYRRPREPVGPEHGSKKDAVVIRRYGEDEITLTIYNDGWAEKVLELSPGARRAGRW